MTQPRILIVEDDPYIARLLECWLLASRYQYVGTAASGQEAIALASSTRPDLVIMDIVLPGDLEGIQTASILLERFDIPALYLTAFTEDELFERARETAPSAYLTKPFNDRELKRAVEVALDRNALLRSMKASEAHLAEAQAVAHIGSWRWDLLQDHVVASDELLRLFELTPGAFEPRFDSFLQRVSADDQPRIRQAVEALLHGGNPADIDVSIPLRNGQQRILRLRGNVHFDADGQAIELVGTALDITREWMARQETEIYRGQLEKKVAQRTADLDATNRRLQAEIADHLKTEKHLCQGEARYRSLVENLPDAVFMMQDERVVFVNPAAVRLAGVQSPDELLGKTLADLAHHDSQKFIEQRKQAALSSRSPNPQIAYSFLRSDGRAVEVESISFAIEYDGRPAFLGVVRDLTERRAIERAAERFRIALDSSPDAIFLIDPATMRFLDFNQTACDSLGYTREELLELGPQDIKPQYNKTTLHERLVEALAGKPGADMIQTVHQRKDGSGFPVEVRLRPFESDGQHLMVVVARDVTARQLAETQLKEANARFSQLAENISGVFWIRDLVEDRFLYVSPGFEALFRKPVSSLYQHPRSFLSAVHPDDQVQVAAAFEWQHQHRQGIDLEYRIIVGDREVRWIWVRTFPVQDLQGNVYRMAGIAEDVTHRRESEEQYRTIIQASIDGFWVADAEGRIVDCNEAYCRALGYTREEVLGLPISELDHSESPEQVAGHIRLVIERGNDRFETRHRHKNGQLIDMEVSAYYQPGATGGRLYAFLRDISRRKQAEQALIKSEERYRGVVEDQTELISRFRVDGTFNFANEVYCRFFGKTVEALVGQTWHPVAFPEDQPDIEEKLGMLSPSHPVVVIENRVVSASGDVHWMQFVNRAFFDGDGRVTEIQSVGRDISDRKTAERALWEAEDFKQAILDAVSTRVAVLDQAGTIIEVNDSWRRFALENSRVAGQTAALSGIGIPYLSLCLANYLGVCPAEQNTCDEGAQEVAQGIRAVLDGSLDVFTHEYPCYVSHQQRWFLMTVTPLGRAQGGVVVAHSDITAPRRLAEELRESEATLERAQTMAQIGSWKLDLETGQLTWSDKTHQIFGTQANTPLTTERFLAFVHPDDRERVNREWGAALAGAPYDVEHRILVGEEVKWVHEQAEIRFDIQGQAVSGYGFVQDINARKQAELALRKSDARSRSILRAAPVGIGVIVDRVFQEVNEAMTTMTGYQADELLGQSARMLYPTQADFDYVGTEKYRQIGERGIGSVETRWRRKDGEIIDVVLSSSPIVADDLSQGVTFTVLDITASKQAEQARQARETSQRNALVQEVHHRIKNNLQGVIGLLRQHMSDHPDTQPAIEAAVAQVNTVAVIHGLQSRRPQQELHLRELLREVSAAAAALAMLSPHPTIEDTLPGDVWLDSNAAVTIALILNELIHNAFKHGLHVDGRGVKIALSGDDRLTLIHIRNPSRSLSEDLDLSTGKGCGTGLDLVRTLLPRRGAQLNLYKEGGMIHVELVLSAPVIHAIEGTGETSK